MNGKRLRKLREGRNLSQIDFAKTMSISNVTVSQYENEIRNPDEDTLIRIAKFFDVSTDYLLGNSDIPDHSHDIRRSSDAVRVPVLGSVAAGIPIEAIEDASDWEEIPADMAANGTYIALTIHGTSMEPKMSEGDVVIIRLQDDVENGDIALVYVNGDDATCKKISKTEKGMWLKGLNDAFEPMFYSWEEVEEIPVRIAGKVVELRAKF